MVKTNVYARVSIVIPVYNEATHLAACLRAISLQTVAPFEVIVVDNNSTDETVAVAERFTGVRLIKQPRQGVVYARNIGFDAARGEIIGRIDADTIIDPDWVDNIGLIMNDKSVDAVSGSVYYYDVTSPKISGMIDLFFRQILARQMGDEVFLYGANMAVRREVWKLVRHELCSESGIHEDFDLGIHVQNNAGRVTFDKRLLAGVSLRRFDGGIVQLLRYMRISPYTYRRHGRTSQKYMYWMISIVLASYWFIWLNHRAYDVETEQASVRTLFTSAAAVGRVNPATYVD
jgi:glycosyltransferase involved in cell wall biosynthesis